MVKWNIEFYRDKDALHARNMRFISVTLECMTTIRKQDSLKNIFSIKLKEFSTSLSSRRTIENLRKVLFSKGKFYIGRHM